MSFSESASKIFFKSICTNIKAKKRVHYPPLYLLNSIIDSLVLFLVLQAISSIYFFTLLLSSFYISCSTIYFFYLFLHSASVFILQFLFYNLFLLSISSLCFCFHLFMCVVSRLDMCGGYSTLL